MPECGAKASAGLRPGDWREATSTVAVRKQLSMLGMAERRASCWKNNSSRRHCASRLLERLGQDFGGGLGKREGLLVIVVVILGTGRSVAPSCDKPIRLGIQAVLRSKRTGGIRKR